MQKYNSPLPQEFISALLAKSQKMLPNDVTRVGIESGEDDLRATLHGAGLHRVRKWKPEDPKDGYTYLEAYKPDMSPVRGVVAIMSLPRYGLTSTFGIVTNALNPLGIPLQQGFGVFWSEVMTALMKDQLDRYQYIVAIDYDTIFDAADVVYLVRLMERTPDAGAICGVQMRRTKPSALLVMKDGVSKVPIEVFEQELVEVKSAHFGLTIIRVDALKKLKKPWFQAVPDEVGEWNHEVPGYIAADIRFWHNFDECGLKLYQANYVSLGHIEEVAIWPSRHLTPVMQNMDDYRLNGVPAEALR